MGNKCKIPNFHFPLFQHKLGQNTSESGLNVMKYHCGVGKKDLLNLEKFLKFSNFFWALQVYSMHPIFTAKCTIATFVKNFSLNLFSLDFFGSKCCVGSYLIIPSETQVLNLEINKL